MFRGLAMLLAFDEDTADAWAMKCVFDGDVAEGAPCAHGPIGPTTGYDHCRSGLRCVDDVCVAMCALSPDSCDAPATCTNPNDGVAIGPSTDYGVCSE